MNKQTKDMTIAEFMNWVLSEYDSIQHVLPSDYTRTIDRLSGYIAAKQGSEEETFLRSALLLLQTAHAFFEVVRMHGNWKIR